MKARIYAKPARDRVSLHFEGEGPNFAVALTVAEAERIANELKDAVKEALQWTG